MLPNNDSTKKILFICGGSYVSGTEIIALSVMKGLKEHGHEIFCITSGWNDGDFISRLKNLEIKFKSIKVGFLYLKKPLWALDTLLNYPKAVLQFIIVQNSFRPDYVFHMSYRSTLMLYFYLDCLKGVLCVQDICKNNFRNKLLLKLVSKKIKIFITCSDFIKSKLLNMGVPVNKISVVLNGVEILAVIQNNKNESLNSLLRIGVVGQIIERKGHEDLLDALHILKNKGYDFLLFIFGKGENAFINKLKSKINNYKLSKSVQWMGFAKDSLQIYTNLDLVVVPTQADEPFGLVAVEPAFWGLPVIASRTGGLPEIVLDNQTGLLFEPKNITDLSEKILYMIKNPDKRHDFGKAAKKRALANFTSEKMCRGIEALL